MGFTVGRFLIGLVVVVIGVILLLNNLVEGIDIDVREILQFWPVIPLILGISWLFASFGSTSSEEGKKVFFSWGQFITAIIAITIGVLFLGRNLGFFRSGYQDVLEPVLAGNFNFNRF